MTAPTSGDREPFAPGAPTEPSGPTEPPDWRPGEAGGPAVEPPPGVVDTMSPPIAVGPGVIPPFAAPPREGHGRRLGLGITIGAVVLVLCCGGGAVGFGALIVVTANQRVNDARTVVTTYMNDWRKQDYPGAYQQLCSDQRDQVTVAEFTESLDDNVVVEFTVAKPVTNGSDLDVPVHVTFQDGDSDDPVFTVVLEKGASKICGQS